MTPLTKFAPPYFTELAPKSSPRSDLNSRTLWCESGKKKETASQKGEEKVRKKREGGRLEVATDLIEVDRTVGWIGSC